MPNSEIYGRVGGGWAGKPNPGGKLPPPSSCTLTPAPGSFTADWPDVPANPGQLLRYDYRYGTTFDLTAAAWVTSSTLSVATVPGAAVPHYVQIRAVANSATGEVLGEPSVIFGPVTPGETALPPPSSCTLAGSTGAFLADWSDVVVPGVPVGRYDYRVGTSVSGVSAAPWVQSNAQSLAMIPVSAVGSYYLQLRTVTQGGVPGNPSQTFGPVNVTTMGAAAFYIAPTARGTGDGSSVTNAAGGIEAIDNAARAGKRDIRLLPGTYDAAAQDAPVDLDAACSGTATTPTWIHGVASDGVSQPAAGSRPVIKGNRVNPYVQNGARGLDIFRHRGAQHMRWSDLHFEACGVCFDFQWPGTNFVIERCSAKNVQRFQENATQPADKDSAGNIIKTYPPASVTNVIISDCEARGFSKQMVRFRYDSSNCRVERCFGDSERQYGDNFTMCFFLDGTAHDISFTDCVGLNAVQVPESGEVTTTDYWNADAFVTEEGNYNITFTRCRGEGCTDGGFDLKAPITGGNLRLIECVARRNKRNFRFHDVKGAVMTRCRGENPNKEGGKGAASSVWLGPSTEVTINDSHFVEQVDAGRSIFRQSLNSTLTVNGGSLTHYPDGPIRSVEDSPTTYTQNTNVQVIRKTP